MTDLHFFWRRCLCCNLGLFHRNRSVISRKLSLSILVQLGRLWSSLFNECVVCYLLYTFKLETFSLLAFQRAELVLRSGELSWVFHLVYGRFIHRFRGLFENTVLTLQSWVCWLRQLAFSLMGLGELRLHVCLPYHFRVVIKRKRADWVLWLFGSLHLRAIVFQVELGQHWLHIGGSVARLVAVRVWMLSSSLHAHSEVVCGRSLVVRTGGLHIQFV